MPSEAPVHEELMWDTPKHAWHAVRVLCDNAGLTLAQKNILCAVIYGESEFNNKALNKNKNSKGEVTSIDYGICQVNSRYHIGPHADFPTVDYVLQNPGNVVQWMIKMYKLGHINWWCAYANGSYKRYIGQIPA